MIKLKDLIEESNVINEDESLLSSIKKYIMGNESIEIGVYYQTDEPYIQNYSKIRPLAQMVCKKILVQRYGFEKITLPGWMGEMDAYYIELDKDNKSKLSDSNVDRILDQVITEFSFKNPPKGQGILVRANLIKRNKIARNIAEKEYQFTKEEPGEPQEFERRRIRAKSVPM
jgi:hypothetical protein